MKFDKIHNKGHARIFANPFLEFFTKGHPLIIWAMYLTITAKLVHYGYTTFNFSATLMVVLYFSGLATWTLLEYIMHRFLFHHLPDNKRVERIVYVLHGNHHHYPRDRSRLFMPPIPSLIISAVLFAISYLFLGKFVFIFFPGFMMGYLLYASVHYAIHAWNPPFKWMKPLWRNHHLHHYKDEDKGFGVSTTIWDHIFGTMFDLKKEKEDVQKTAELKFGPRRMVEEEA